MEEFRVTVVARVTEAQGHSPIAAAIEQAAAQRLAWDRATGGATPLRLEGRVVASTAELEQTLQAQLISPVATRLIVVSDELLTTDAAGVPEATEQVRRLRDLYVRQTSSAHLLALIAWVAAKARRITDLDGVVDSRSDPTTALAAAIRRAALGLWLKSPPPRDPAHRPPTIAKIRVVRSLSELRDCLRLRHLVYSALGYLDDYTVNHQAGLELDRYDDQSLHLGAFSQATGEVIGTLRLVLPAAPAVPRRGLASSPAPESVELTSLPSAKALVRIQGQWMARLAEDDREFFDRLRTDNPQVPFPVMDNTDFGALWREFLVRYNILRTAEISRVVVAPAHRGTGVSAVLMRAAIAIAPDLGLEHLLLECIPTHVDMYRKYGFEALPRCHSRARGLDQVAVGMKLDLEEGPENNRAVALQHRDLRMLRLGMTAPGGPLLGRRGLCLCSREDCWKQGDYGVWGSPACPLSHLMEIL